MTTAIYVIIVVASIIALSYFLYNFVKKYLKWCGQRLVICPETKKPTAVQMDAKHAAITATLGGQDLILKDCTRWPERQDCGQQCLRQIETSPENCLIRNILTNWYNDKTCIYCGQKIEEIHWHDHKPVFRSPDGNFVEWSQVPVENLPIVLETHTPVCWNCFIAENFRRQYPELVLDRHAKRGYLV